MEIKKILVPVDFSPCSIHAAEVAAQVARKTDARIYFLHLISFPNYEGNLPYQDYQDIAENLFIMKLVRKKFQELFQQPFLKDVNFAEAVSFHGIYEAITEQAEKNQIDLIVMGTHGTSGFMDKVLGSNTDKVIRMSSLPVITVKNKPEQDNPIDKIVFAVDFAENTDQGFEKVSGFAKLFNAKIELLRVITPNNFQTSVEIDNQMSEFADRTKLSNFSMSTELALSVEEGVIAYSKRTKADFIATVNYGKSTFSQLFNKSVTRELVNESDLPVLTVKL